MSLICGRMSPLTTIPTYQLAIKAPRSASPSGKSPECHPFTHTHARTLAHTHTHTDTHYIYIYILYMGGKG